MNTLARYLSELRKTRSAGAVPETSYYPALAELFSTIGMGVSPKVRAIVHPKNLGAGTPDIALFSWDQLPRDGEPRPGVLPSRGVVEAKGTGDDLDKIVKSKQVAKYLLTYGQVLVTNLREFVLVVEGEDGQAAARERFALAASESDFWDPSVTDDSRHDLFVNYLKRALLSNAPIKTPKDLAWLLASYARDALARVEGSDLEALAQLRIGMEEALGITFTGERGDHFFRSTLVQTLFYGVFSAWVLWHRRGAKGVFNWKTANFELKVPMIRALFHQASDPQRLEPLGLVEILDWAGDAINRVQRDVFFEKFAVENAVQYFYEPFLEAFDPELRRELGVWYTPREIVRYQVARVDTALREELGVADGLADPSVVVLDPCCGTGAYLVEVIKLIHDRLTAGGADMLALNDVKRAAMDRIFGFEILPAPFVVAHLQMALLLQTMGAPLAANGSERVGVFLTNALTGWDGDPPQKAMIFPELAAERDAASKIKRTQKILVVLGNPPYNGYAGIAIDEERTLSNAYRTTKLAPKPQGQGLNDLYVRFFRMAERRIVEQSGSGVVCFISNYSWLDGLSFTGMRERYLEVFDKIWIDNLHGDRIISEYAPDGRTSETIFATGGGFSGIRIGTSIATLVRKLTHQSQADIYYHDWDEAKADERRKALLASVESDVTKIYTSIIPNIQIGLPFKPRSIGDGYTEWTLLPNMFPSFFPGVQTKRDEVVVDVDRDRLEGRMQKYFNPELSNEQVSKIVRGSMDDTARYNSAEVRNYLVKRGYLPKYLVRYSYRPLDLRWIYWEPETKLLGEKSPAYFQHSGLGTSAIVAQQISRKEWSVPQVIQSLGNLDLVDRGASIFPIRLKNNTPTNLFNTNEESVNSDGMIWNLSDNAREYLKSLDAPLDSLFYHALAVMHSPVYRTENAGALRQDWPRIPLPAEREVLEASAALGRRVAGLLDTESAVDGVTIGTVRAELREIALLSRNDGGTGMDGDALAVTAGWGNATRAGVMPGRGKIVQREPESRRAGEPESRRAGEPESRRAGEPESRRAGGRRNVRHSWRANIRRVSQRSCVLAQHPRSRVALHARRLSSYEEMAFVSGERRAGTQLETGGGAGSAVDGAPHRGADLAGRGAG